MHIPEIPQPLKVLEDDSKSTGEKLHGIAKYFAPMIYDKSKSYELSEFERYEALIFTSFWVLRSFIKAGYKIDEQTQFDLFQSCERETDLDVRDCIYSSDEFADFYENRISFYESQVSIMNDENFDFHLLLNKLYINPMTGSVI